MGISKISGVSAGDGCSIAGRVIRTFEERGRFIATVIDDSGKIEVSSDSPFSLGSMVLAAGKAVRLGSKLVLEAKEAQFLGEGQAELGKRIDLFISKQAQPAEFQMLIGDGVMNLLKPGIGECARRILTARLLERPIVLRYHGDSDGICAGLALFRAIGSHGGKLLAIQSAHAVYELQDAFRDMNDLRSFAESAGPPLLVLADMGSSPESADAIGVLKGAGFEIAVIDHHPLSQEVSDSASFILSPMPAGGTSYYTAGLLAGEVSKAMGSTWDAAELQEISLAGDKSGIAKHSPEAVRKALALDYLGKYSKFQSTLEFYGSALSNEVMLASVYSQASAKMERAARIAKESLKVKELENGFRLCTSNLERAFKPGSFPGKGMLCGALHDLVSAEMKGPLVTIGYSGRLISIRANTEARERGFDANAIINGIRRELTNAIETGGGHDVASSIHVHDGFENIVLEELVRHIGAL